MWWWWVMVKEKSFNWFCSWAIHLIVTWIHSFIDANLADIGDQASKPKPPGYTWVAFKSFPPTLVDARKRSLGKQRGQERQQVEARTHFRWPLLSKYWRVVSKHIKDPIRDSWARRGAERLLCRAPSHGAFPTKVTSIKLESVAFYQHTGMLITTTASTPSCKFWAHGPKSSKASCNAMAIVLLKYVLSWSSNKVFEAVKSTRTCRHGHPCDEKAKWELLTYKPWCFHALVPPQKWSGRVFDDEKDTTLDQVGDPQKGQITHTLKFQTESSWYKQLACKSRTSSRFSGTIDWLLPLRCRRHFLRMGHGCNFKMLRYEFIPKWIYDLNATRLMPVAMFSHIASNSWVLNLENWMPSSWAPKCTMGAATGPHAKFMLLQTRKEPTNLQSRFK